MANPAAFAPTTPTTAKQQSPAVNQVQLAAVTPTAFRPAPPSRDLFGTVALRASGLAAQDKWDSIVSEQADAHLATRCEGDSGSYCGPAWQPWRSLVDAAATLAPIDQLSAINSGVNRLIQYTEDKANYGASDHWATLQETVARQRGDCEDYAIAKMWLLASLGVPLDSMQLVVARDIWRGKPHAVLAVYLDGRAFILDNLMNAARPADELNHYVPVYSISSAGSWVHGVLTQNSNAPAQPANEPASGVPLPPLR